MNYMSREHKRLRERRDWLDRLVERMERAIEEDKLATVVIGLAVAYFVLKIVQGFIF